VTYSGAQAIMSIDAATGYGLELATLQGKTLENLSRIISSPAKSCNPVDMFPDMMVHGFEKTTTEILLALMEDEDVNGIIFISFARPKGEDLLPLVEIVGEHKRAKPVFFCMIGSKEDVDANREFLEKRGVPFYLFPEKAIRVFSNMWRYAQIRGVA
jgi:acyl-CoA synthetase (NDP forming)